MGEKLTNEQRDYLEWLFQGYGPKRIRAFSYALRHAAADRLNIRPEDALVLLENFAREKENAQGSDRG